MRWLKTQEVFEVDVRLFASACEGGNWECLKWLRSEGFDWRGTNDEEKSCEGAAKGGHFEVLKWLRNEGCPWDHNACAGAAEGGHVEIIDWLLDFLSPWDERACSRAAYQGHLDVLEWHWREGCPWISWDEKLFASAALVVTWRY